MVLLNKAARWALIPSLAFSMLSCANLEEERRLELEAEKVKISQQSPFLRLTCPATEEFTKVHKFLRDYKGVSLSEKAIQTVADEVSRNCLGAAKRFRDTLEPLIKMGVAHSPSLEIAKRISAQTDVVKDNFVEILKSAYLKEYLDFNFVYAVNLAYQFSFYAESNPKAVRNDFVSLVGFCKDQHQLGLAINLCSQYAVELAKVSHYFEQGLYPHFQKIYTKLTSSEEGFGLSLRDALAASYDILAYGPLASDNFMNAYQYARSKEGLNLPNKPAFDFALTMAGRSLNRLHPLVQEPRFVAEIEESEKAPDQEENAPLPAEQTAPRVRGPASETND